MRGLNYNLSLTGKILVFWIDGLWEVVAYERCSYTEVHMQ